MTIQEAPASSTSKYSYVYSSGSFSLLLVTILFPMAIVPICHSFQLNTEPTDSPCGECARACPTRLCYPPIPTPLPDGKEGKRTACSTCVKNKKKCLWPKEKKKTTRKDDEQDPGVDTDPVQVNIAPTYCPLRTRKLRHIGDSTGPGLVTDQYMNKIQ